MTNVTNDTTSATPRGFTTAGPALTVTLTFPESHISVAVGKGSGLVNSIHLDKLSPELIAYAAMAGFAKALADTSDKSLSAEGVQALRAKRIATWEGGDWAGKGGGVPNPLAGTMREVAVSRIVKATGKSRKDAEATIKGTLVDWMTAIQTAKLKATGHAGYPDSEDAIDDAVRAAMVGLEAEARKLIAQREATRTAAKVTVDAASLADLF